MVNQPPPPPSSSMPPPNGNAAAATPVRTAPAPVGETGVTMAEIRQLLAREGNRSGRITARMDVILAIAGSVALPLGLVLILLGWYGAAHTPFVFEQVPYLISGGLLGVGFVIGGGLLFFGSWLSRLAGETQRGNQQLAEAIDRLQESVAQRGGTPVNGIPIEPTTAVGRMVATPTGTLRHLPTCSAVASRTDVIDVPADAAGYEPCDICQPG